MVSVWVYAIVFDSGEIYVGLSADLEQRMKQHRSRQSSSTKRFKGDFAIVYSKSLPSYAEARKHEKFLKSGAGRSFIQSVRT